MKVKKENKNRERWEDDNLRKPESETSGKEKLWCGKHQKESLSQTGNKIRMQFREGQRVHADPIIDQHTKCSKQRKKDVHEKNQTRFQSVMARKEKCRGGWKPHK